MIKRQHFVQDRGASASSSSSSSDDSGLSQAGEEDEVEWPASSRESEGSDEEDFRAAGTSADLKDNAGPKKTSKLKSKVAVSTKTNQYAEAIEETEKEKLEDTVVLQLGNVFKCRLCPKTICLSEDSMQAHLESKGHARSLKQFSEGRLKVTLNSDGEVEEEGETHADRYARTVATLESQETAGKRRRRDSGRQRQRKRAKKALLTDKQKTKTKKKKHGGKP